MAAYDKYAPAISRHIFFRVSDQNLTEDLTQETFLKAWRNIARSGKDVKNFKTFFYTIANNLIIDHYRGKSRKTISLEEVGEQEAVCAPTQKEEAERSIDRNFIEKHLARIGDEYRQIILYRYVDDLSIKEISEITGKSKNNVGVMIHRGIKMLREQIYVQRFKN